MKRFLKSNTVVILIIIVFSIVFFNADYKVIKNQKKIEEYHNSLVEKCKKIVEYKDENEKELCRLVLNEKEIEVDFYTLYSEVLAMHVKDVYYIAFLIVIIPTMLKVCKILKYKHIINSNSREGYHSFLKKLLKVAYQYIWVLALLSFIMMIPIMMNTTMNPEYAISYNSSFWETNTMQHPVLFVISYLINVTLYSMIFIHIALLVARKQQKTIPCIIISYILYLAIEIFLETVVRLIIIRGIFHSELGMIFNIINVFGMNDLYGVGPLLLVNLYMVLVSFGLVYLAYKDKEKFVIQCEKNK